MRQSSGSLGQPSVPCIAKNDLELCSSGLLSGAEIIDVCRCAQCSEIDTLKGVLISASINSFLIFSLKDFYCINCSLLHKKKLPCIRWLTVADLSPQFPGQERHKDKQVSKCQRGGNSPQTQAAIFRVHSLSQNPFACGCNLPVSLLAVTWGLISAPGSHQRCYWQFIA